MKFRGRRELKYLMLLQVQQLALTLWKVNWAVSGPELLLIKLMII